MFVIGGPEIADHVGICPVCLGAYHPGDSVVREEDYSVVHEEHSTWSDSNVPLGLHA